MHSFIWRARKSDPLCASLNQPKPAPGSASAAGLPQIALYRKRETRFTVMAILLRAGHHGRSRFGSASAKGIEKGIGALHCRRARGAHAVQPSALVANDV